MNQEEVTLKFIRKKASLICVFMSILILLISTPYQSALAAMVGTEAVLEMSKGQVARDYLHQVLARRDVRSFLIKQGTDPIEAKERIESLTDFEVIQLANHIEQLPAGGSGVGVVVGVLLFILLIVLIMNQQEK
jgi:uncharacterized integral membrane protein